VSNDAHEANFLLFDSLSNHVDLVQMGVHSVTANVAFFFLLLKQFLLRLTRSRGQKVVWDFPGKYFFEGPKFGRQL
jgi:hypothetical protein